MDEGRPFPRVRISSGHRLLVLLVLASALGWAAASTFVVAQLQDRARQDVITQARRLGTQVRSLVETGSPLEGEELTAVLTVGRGWLVNAAGQVVAGPETPPPPLPVDPEEVHRSGRITTTIGPEGGLAVTPLIDDGSGGIVLLVDDPGSDLGAQLNQVRLLLGAAFAGLVVVVAAVGATLMRQMRLGLEQRTNALTTLLRRERETVERLGEVDALKSAFLTSISHGLRTPLTIVAGFTELLANRGDQLPRAQIKQMAAALEDKTHRLTRLIDDLLDVDRLARGVLEPDRQWIQPRAVFERTAEALPATDHELRLEAPDIEVHVDPAHLQRVVENLVRNAQKHAPPGSAIDVVGRADGTSFELVVADRGPGIPEDQLDRVFEPLQHADHDDPNPGLGVGLALVARLAEIHGGSAWACPRDGGGLEAHVRFAEAVRN